MLVDGVAEGLAIAGLFRPVVGVQLHVTSPLLPVGVVVSTREISGVLPAPQIYVLSMVLTVKVFAGILTLTTFDVGMLQPSFTVTVTSIYCTEPICVYGVSFAGDWLTHVIAPPQPSEDAATTVLSKSGILYLQVPAATASTVSRVPIVPISGATLSSTVTVVVVLAEHSLSSFTVSDTV